MRGIKSRAIGVGFARDRVDHFPERSFSKQKFLVSYLEKGRI